jgi:hypothetical protein
MIGGRGLAGSELAQHRQPADLRCPAAVLGLEDEVVQDSLDEGRRQRLYA